MSPNARVVGTVVVLILPLIAIHIMKPQDALFTAF